MANDNVSDADIYVDIPAPIGVSIKLTKLQGFDAKDQASAEVTTSIGFRRGTGFRFIPGGFEIDCISYREVGKRPEVDWFRVRDLRIIYTMTTQDQDNGRRQAYRCVVSKVDTKKDNKGVHEDTITMVATTQFNT